MKGKAQVQNINPLSEEKRRRPKIPADAARAILIRTLAHLICRDGIDKITIEHVAMEAHLNKMSVYRLFGSRDSLVHNCVRWLREDQERCLMQSAMVKNFSAAERIRSLFGHLSRAILDGDERVRAFGYLFRRFADLPYPVQREFAVHRSFLRTLFSEVAIESDVHDSYGLVDDLLLTWDGIALGTGPEDELRRVAVRLPGLAIRILRSYETVDASDLLLDRGVDE